MESGNTISQPGNQNSAMRDASELIIEFLRIITQEGEYCNSMMKALEALSQYIYADRIYLLEQQRRLDGRFFEWCAEGVPPRIARIKEVSDSELALFVARFKGCDIIYGETLEKLGIRDPRSFAYFRALGVESLLAVPLRENGRFVGVIGADNYKLADDVDVKRILETISPFAATVISNYQLLEELEWSGSHDWLTGLLNRRGVDIALSEYLSGGDEPFALALIDIDDFKGINDQHGHAVGDAVLETLADAMRRVFPEGSILGRQGGDELLVIVTGEAVGQADELFQRFVREDLSVDSRGETVKLTTSVGYTVFPEIAPSVRVAYNQADKALYAIKQSGKAGAGKYVPTASS